MGAGIGYSGGSGLAKGLFTDTEDRIPDAIKEMGPLAERMYADALLSKGHWMDDQETPLEPEEIEELVKFRNEVVSPENVRNWLEDSDLADKKENERMPALIGSLRVLGADQKTADIYLKEAQNLWGADTTTRSAVDVNVRNRRSRLPASARQEIVAGDAMPMPMPTPPVMPATQQHMTQAPRVSETSRVSRSRTQREPRPRPAPVPSVDSGKGSGTGLPNMLPDEYGIALAKNMMFN